MLIKRIIKKLFFPKAINSVNINACNIFQELSYIDFKLKPALLDEYLCNLYDLDSKIKFFSFRKFFKLPQVVENYVYNLKNSFKSFSIEKNDIIIDIGAHHGIFTIKLASLGAKVHSFEPNPMSVEIINKNIEANSFTITPIVNNYAVSLHDNESVNFDLGVRSTAGSIKNLKHKELQSGEKIKVNTLNIDNYIINNKLKNIKLLKMDCEGAEYEIFKSSSQIYNINYLIIEAHETLVNTPEDLIKELNLNGYKVNKVKANYGAYELYCKKQ